MSVPGTFLRTACPIAGGLLAAEAVLRVFGERAIAGASHHRLFCEFDPLLGWRKTPAARGFHVTPEYQVYERFNSRGLRSREFPLLKPKHETRILFLGDSFAEGYSVHFHELFSERLERELNARGPGTHRCINAGTGGYSTDQELLYFRAEGHEYRPDATVLMFCENDLIDNCAAITHRGAAKPVFRIGAGGRPAPVNLPLQKPAVKAPNREPGLAEQIVSKSYLASMGAASLASLALVAEMGRRKLASCKPGYQAPLDIRVWEETWPTALQEAWLLTTALLREMRESVAQCGSRFTIFCVPPESAVYPEVFETMRNVWGMAKDGVNPFVLGKKLRQWCLSENIEFIDPTAEFRSAARRLAQTGDRLYYPLDGHWTRAGHALAANILRLTISAWTKN
jgi:lysophospholipase L1-like esterase